MKRTKKTILLLLLLCLLSLTVLTGCGGDKSGSTIDEPEITGDYLAEDYSQQLLTDGAETMLGFIKITEHGESYNVEITEKEVVLSSGYEEGYYIADTNLTKELVLGFDARIVCLHDGELKIETADKFIKKHNDNPDQLYTVYYMGDSAELILATEPTDVEIK